MVDIDKSIDITKITPSTRVALRNDSYVLHLVLPSKVDPLVNLMKVEKVPDSTYDMIGGLDQQIKEIKEVCFLCLSFAFFIVSLWVFMDLERERRRKTQMISLFFFWLIVKIFKWKRK